MLIKPNPLLKRHKGKSGSDVYSFDFPPQEGAANLCFVFRGRKDNLLVFNSFSFN